jgi:hypothetical protein
VAARTRADLPDGIELLRGDHLPGDAGSDAGTDVRGPKRGWWFATLSLAGSMVGALVGYALGHYAFEAIKPLFEALGMLPAIEQGITTVQAKMAESPWAVFTFLVLGGFMPIPMKSSRGHRVSSAYRCRSTC